MESKRVFDNPILNLSESDFQEFDRLTNRKTRRFLNFFSFWEDLEYQKDFEYFQAISIFVEDKDFEDYCKIVKLLYGRDIVVIYEE